MRGGRFSPGRVSLTSLRDRGPGGRLAGGLMWSAAQPTGPNERVDCALHYDGDLDRGRTQGETRTLQGLTVTNYGPVPVAVEVEQIGGQSFSATVQPGQSVEVAGLALTQFWNAAHNRWDGLNIRWKEPA